jgi:hypothetical protein
VNVVRDRHESVMIASPTGQQAPSRRESSIPTVLGGGKKLFAVRSGSSMARSILPASVEIARQERMKGELLAGILANRATARGVIAGCCARQTGRRRE